MKNGHYFLTCFVLSLIVLGFASCSKDSINLEPEKKGLPERRIVAMSFDNGYEYFKFTYDNNGYVSTLAKGKKNGDMKSVTYYSYKYTNKQISYSWGDKENSLTNKSSYNLSNNLVSNHTENGVSKQYVYDKSKQLIEIRGNTNGKNVSTVLTWEKGNVTSISVDGLKTWEFSYTSIPAQYTSYAFPDMQFGATELYMTGFLGTRCTFLPEQIIKYVGRNVEYIDNFDYTIENNLVTSATIMRNIKNSYYDDSELSFVEMTWSY